MKISLLLFLLCFSFNSFAQGEVEIKCDSIYPNKKIVIKLSKYNEEEDGYFGEKNSILVIEKNSKPIIKDSIFNKVQEIKFEDFNNDKIKDILVQNISDVRSNWTYYLYLYNPKTEGFERVKGFEEIKNPKFNSKDNIIESYVMSGQNWVGFYKIKNNRAIDLKMEIDDGENFEREYEKAIKKIKSKK